VTDKTADDSRQREVRIDDRCPVRVPRSPHPPDPRKVTRFTPHYRQAPARPGVYLFLAVGSGLVKIGFTECVAQRIQGVCGPAGESAGYLADVRGGREVERFLHKVFAKHRADIPRHREWFYFTPGMHLFVTEARNDYNMTRQMCPRELDWDERNWPRLRNAP
jgi:hypothetical protein